MEIKKTIQNPEGLHARPAGHFAKQPHLLKVKLKLASIKKPSTQNLR